MAVCRVARVCPFAAPLAVALPPVADVASGISLACLFLHPLLNRETVRADADSPALDVQDDGGQVTVPIRSLDATGIHSLQKPSGDVLGDLSAAAGGNGKYGIRGAKSHAGSQGRESQSRLLHSCLWPGSGSHAPPHRG